MEGEREGWAEHLFIGEVVYCELDLAHAASAECLGEGVVAEDSGG